MITLVEKTTTLVARAPCSDDRCWRDGKEDDCRTCKFRLNPPPKNIVVVHGAIPQSKVT